MRGHWGARVRQATRLRTPKAGGRDLDGRTWDKMPSTGPQIAAATGGERSPPFSPRPGSPQPRGGPGRWSAQPSRARSTRNSPAGMPTHTASGLAARSLTGALSSGPPSSSSDTCRDVSPSASRVVPLVAHTSPPAATSDSPTSDGASSKTARTCRLRAGSTRSTCPLAGLLTHTASGPTSTSPASPAGPSCGRPPSPPGILMVATTRLLARSTRQIGPPAPVTHTPLGPAPTTVGSPGSRILTTTWLLAGSIRTSDPVGWAVLIPVQQHSAHTPTSVTTGAPTPTSASVATTRLLCGSTRNSRSLDCDTHSAPVPAAIPATQQPPRTGGRPIVATTRLVWGSTRETAQPCAAQTAFRSAATAVTRPSRR